MKQIFRSVALFLCLLLLTACDMFRVYQADEFLPPLIDITTQYPYTESITIMDANGVLLAFTDGSDHDNIRMRMEGIQCIHTKMTKDAKPLFTITYHTTDGDVSFEILSEYEFIFEGEQYEALRGGIDVVYFSNLFAE